MTSQTFRIILLAKYDISALIACNELVPELLKRQHHLTIFIGDLVRKPERENPRANSVIQLERDFPDCEFRKLDEDAELIKQLREIGDYDWRKHGMLTYQQMALKYNIRAEFFKSAINQEWLKTVKDLQPDIILNVRNNMIYKKPLIEIPKIGIFNTHLGPLPRYAGLYAAFRQIANNETRVGCTLHVIDEGIDTGAIIEIAYHDVIPSRSVVWHQVQMYRNGGRMFVKFVDDLSEGKRVEQLARTRRPDEEIEYFGQVSDEEFQEFEKRGKKVVLKEEIDEFLEEFFGHKKAQDLDNNN